MAQSSVAVCVLCLGVLIGCSVAEISNDIDVPTRGSLPKPVSYFTFPPADEATHYIEKPQGARFAYPGVTNLEGYGPNVLSQAYYPFKFDVGGLVLGTVVGVGALLLIPKIMHLLVPELGAFGQYGPYARNVDFMPQGVHHIVSQFEKVMTENNINSSECLQKAICSYVQSSAPKNNRARTADVNDVNANKSISDYMIGFLIDGSKFKTAIQNGERDVSCSVLYPKCPFNQNSVATGIKQLILSNSTFPSQSQDSN